MSLYERVFITEVRDLPPAFPTRPGRKKADETYKRQAKLDTQRRAIIKREKSKEDEMRAKTAARDAFQKKTQRYKPKTKIRRTWN